MTAERTTPFVWERWGDVVVVRLLQTAPHFRAAELRELYQDVVGHAKSEGLRKFVLCFGSLVFVGSETLALLFQLQKVIRAAGVRVVISCLSEFASEMLRVARVDSVFPIAHSTADAIAFFGGVSAPCPVAHCGGVAHLTERVESAPRSSTVALRCSNCGTECLLSAPEKSPSASNPVAIAVLQIPSYDGEAVELISPAAPEMGIGVYRIRIVGRLDLFSFASLEKALATLPRPRRAVIDLEATTNVSRAGVEGLRAWCGPGTEGDRAAVLVRPDQGDVPQMLEGLLPVCQNLEVAVTALGEIPEESRRLLTVLLRSHDGSSAAT